MSSSLCIYAYYEKDQTYYDNAHFFLKYGINDESDFVFVINGTCSLELPNVSNFRAVRRPNTGYDFGAYSSVLQDLRISDRLRDYRYFFFVNSSVRGPFVTSSRRCWQASFIDMFSDDTRLVGTTVNMCPSPMPRLQEKGFVAPFTHVQTQMFAMTLECLEHVLENSDIFDPNVQGDFGYTIEMKEVYLSQLVLRNGWNIDCLAPLYKGLDYRTVRHNINLSSPIHGDCCWSGTYFGGTVNPLEIMFIKTNRDIFVYL
jgi:hypothetical protein